MTTDRRTAILEGAARVIARRGVRGLRVEELAADAGVSTALIYYHFKDRAGILRHTLEFISDRADRYTADKEEGPTGPLDPHEELERSLLLEFQDRPKSARTARPGANCGPARSSSRNSARTWPAPA